MLPSVRPTTSAPETFKLSRLNGWPMRSPADASTQPSRIAVARLGADAVRYSFIVADFHRLLLAGFAGAPVCLTFCTASNDRSMSILRVRNFLPERSVLARLSLSAFDRDLAHFVEPGGRWDKQRPKSRVRCAWTRGKLAEKPHHDGGRPQPLSGWCR